MVSTSVRPSWSRTKLLFLAALLGTALPALTRADNVNWTAVGPGTSWGTGANWSNGSGPAPADIAIFGTAGATNTSVTVSNVLDVTRTVDVLAYEVPASKFHVTNLNGLTLNVSGELDVNNDVPNTATAIIRGGVLNVGTPQALANIVVARRTLPGSNFTATLDLSGLSNFTANLDNLFVGTALSGQATGRLLLPTTTSITANSIQVGYSPTDAGTGTSLLSFRTNNTVLTNELIVGGGLSSGQVSVLSNGTLNLGSAAQRTNLVIGQHGTNANNANSGIMSLSSVTFNGMLSNLTVGDNTGGGGGVSGSFFAGTAGSIDIGTQANPGNLIVGHVQSGGSATGYLDLSGLSAMQARLNQMVIGQRGNAEVYLAASNDIEVNSFIVGERSSTSLVLGTFNTILADNWQIGNSYSNGTVSAQPGGTVEIGSESQRTKLSVGNVVTNTNDVYSATADFSGTTLNAWLGDLAVGVRPALPGAQLAFLYGGNTGAMHVGAADDLANLSIGINSNATVDLSGLETFDAHLNQAVIGTDGTANVKLAATSTIEAHKMIVGQNGTANLVLGANNSLIVDDLQVGNSNSNGTLSVLSGGATTLGSELRPTSLSVGNVVTNTNSTFSASADFSGGTLNAQLSDLSVGVRPALPGGQLASLVGGSGGAIQVGATGNTANMLVGQNSNASVDFSAMSTFDANLNNLGLGVNGNATVKLADTNTIDAKTMTVGENGSASLQMGTNATLLVDSLQIGNSFSNGTAFMLPGGSFKLGSAVRPTELAIGKVSINTNSTFSATLDLSGADVDVHLNNLFVGQRLDSLPGGQIAKLVGGQSGTFNVGQSGNTAKIVVGTNTNSLLDLSGVDNFNANLNSMTIGINGTGAVALAETNVIDAKSMIVGANGNATLALGHTNTLLVDDLQIGNSFSNGTVTVAAGGVLNLGSQLRPTYLAIGNALTNTNNTYTGTLDVGNATLHAVLSQVIIGQKDPLPGGQRGVFTISGNADNSIVADTIFMGGTSADGRLNFGGGDLTANSITKGDGTATFNWLGGTLHVGVFGTPARPFNLNNTNFGVLSPGASPGTTAVYGNYQQGLAAALKIELAGTLPGSQFDHVVVSQNATLAGSLIVDLLDGFLPQGGDKFTILTAASVTGDFDTLALPLLGPNRSWQVNYGSTFVELQVLAVPEPGTLMLAGLGFASIVCCVRRKRRR